MRVLIVLLVCTALVLAGCGSPAPPAKNVTGNNQSPPAQPPPSGVPPATSPPPSQPPVNNTTVTPTPPPPTGGTTTQQDCATLTPNCGACIDKPGCGWCKSSSSCFKGDSSGPAGDIQCQPADWAVTEEACQAPTSPQGTTCAEQVGCGNCLSGDGCKFCRQGAVCAGVSSADDCFGGWLTEFYQCAAGSQ
jgi:hypothetical protein